MVNDLGVDPNDWFDNPLDRMPISRDEPLDLAPSSYEPPDERVDPPAELMEVPTSVTNPKPMPKSKPKKEETLHHKMYEIATSKYNPFSVGGSESIQDLGGGSEKMLDR